MPVRLLFLSFLISTAVSIEWTKCVLDHLTTNSDPTGSLHKDQYHKAFKHFYDFHNNLASGNATKRFTDASVAECAEVNVPGTYNTDPSLNGTYTVPNENGDTEITYLTIKIARVVRTGSSKAVFHFAGGPGESSYILFGSLLGVLAETYDADVYAMNIRGVGYEDSIHIPFYDSTTPPEFQEKFHELSPEQQILLSYFTTDNNARDINYVISSLNLTQTQEIIMVGHSYGTYLVHRFVQMFPGVVSRAILDSSCAGPKGTIMDETLWANTFWFPQLVEKCNRDAFCNSTFEGRAQEIIYNALKSSSSCGEFTMSDAFKFTALTAFNQPDNFQLTFALLRRFSRCNFDDSSTLTTLMRIPFFNWQATVDYFNSPSAPYDGEVLNTAVLFQIRGSEMSRNPFPGNEQIAQEMNTGPFRDFAPNPTQLLYSTRRSGDFWPWSQVSPYASSYAPSTFTQFLLISGEIDYKTPLFLSEDFVKNVPQTQWLIVPGGGHVSGFSTACGAQAITDYIVDPSKNLTCPTTTLPITFHVSPAISLQLQLNKNFDWYGNDNGLGPLGWSLIVIAIVVALVGLVCCVVWWKKNQIKNKRETADRDRIPLIH